MSGSGFLNAELTFFIIALPITALVSSFICVFVNIYRSRIQHFQYSNISAFTDPVRTKQAAKAVIVAGNICRNSVFAFSERVQIITIINLVGCFGQRVCAAEDTAPVNCVSSQILSHVKIEDAAVIAIPNHSIAHQSLVNYSCRIRGNEPDNAADRTFGFVLIGCQIVGDLSGIDAVFHSRIVPCAADNTACHYPVAGNIDCRMVDTVTNRCSVCHTDDTARAGCLIVISRQLCCINRCRVLRGYRAVRIDHAVFDHVQGFALFLVVCGCSRTPDNRAGDTVSFHLHVIQNNVFDGSSVNHTEQTVSPVHIQTVPGILTGNLTVADGKALSIISSAECAHSLGICEIIPDGHKFLTVQIDVLRLEEVHSRKLCRVFAGKNIRMLVVHGIPSRNLFLKPQQICRVRNQIRIFFRSRPFGLGSRFSVPPGCGDNFSRCNKG